MMHSKLLTAILVIAVILASFWLGTVWDGQGPSAVKPSGTSTAGEEPFLGSENTKVQITVFSDFECPFCGKAAPITHQIAEAYPEQVKVTFRNFPLSFHANAQKAAEASECANLQGKFWEMHDKMYENQNDLRVDSLKRYAQELGLDTEEFNECLDSGSMKAEVEDDFQAGTTAGVQGTPTFVINGELVVGAQPFAKFQEVIDRKLAE